MDDVVDIPSWLWLEDGGGEGGDGGGNEGGGRNEGDGGNKGGDGNKGGGSDSDDDSYQDDSIGEDDGIGARTVDDRLRMWHSRFGNNLCSEFEDYDYELAAEALWNAFDDGAGSDGWESTDSELFNGVVNVEVPVSPVAPRREVVREPDRYHLHLRQECWCGCRRQHRPAAGLYAKRGYPFSPLQSFVGRTLWSHLRE